MRKLIDADSCLHEAWQNFYKQEDEDRKNIDGYDIMRDEFYEQRGFECCQQTIVNAKPIEAILKADLVAILDKMRAEIENHCSLAKEDHCKYCSRCLSMMGVREILELIDKYKVLSCNPLKTNEEEEE